MTENLLELEMARLAPSPVTVEKVLRRHGRRERNQRFAAGVLAATIFAAVVAWLGVSLVGRDVRPADRPAPPVASEAFLTLGRQACDEKRATLDRWELPPPGFVDYSTRAVRDVRRIRSAYVEFVDRLVALPLPPGDPRAADLVALWERVPERFDEVLAAAREGRVEVFEARLTNLWPLLGRAMTVSVAYGICTTEPIDDDPDRVGSL